MSSAVGHRLACACGAVAAVAAGEATSVTYCHCSHCRRRSGAPFTVWVGFADDAVAFAGETPVERHTSETVTRGHCERCGANVTYRDAGLPGRVYVPVGAFDDPGAFVPTEHAYWLERVAWLTVADDLPKRDAVTQVRHARNARHASS